MKRIVLGFSLVATLIGAYFAPPEEQQVKAVKKEKPKNYQLAAYTPAAENAVTNALPGKASNLAIRPRNAEGEFDNVFASQTWTPPVVKPDKNLAQPAKPEAPQAPALPFKFMGRWIENEKTVFFLNMSDRDLAVSVGDTIDNTYKLESIEGGTLTFTYLPLKQKQTLVAGEVN